ncbi:DUF2735 domain-containing protein [Neorhizobium sp. NCHU2750]|uniref:DUF2735 domain-containing protein n=1 Tax=Neorhizobium sp. NCHU2750 TaxID=1825976 RepID=UPI000E756394|nr:hypothetical protein NCHU2750_25380 [Neorhizobium sp. NCHU2750]
MRSVHRESAKIYQFPLMPRRRLDNGLTVPSAPDVVLSVVDMCWYHDEAVRGEDQPQERPKPC